MLKDFLLLNVTSVQYSTWWKHGQKLALFVSPCGFGMMHIHGKL
jgi:hypothetical protein